MISILRHPFSDGHLGRSVRARKSSILQAGYLTEWKILYKKLHDFFTEEYQSDWEKKTGRIWRESVR